MRVFYLEADDQTTAADLNGTGGNTAGDWVTGTQYAIIDNAGSIFDSLQRVLLPHHLHGMPIRILTESGQVDVNEHASHFRPLASLQLKTTTHIWLTTTATNFSAVAHGMLSVN